MATPYPPTIFVSKYGAESEEVTTWRQHWEMIFDGWKPVGPVPPPFVRDQDTDVAALVDDEDSLTRLAFLKHFAPHFRATSGDQTARLAEFLSTPGIKRLSGDFTVSDYITPASGVTIDAHDATITQTADLTPIFRTESADNFWLVGLTAYGVTDDYFDASGVYDACAVYVSGTSDNVRVSDCTFLGFAGAGVNVASTAGSVEVRGCRMTGAPELIAVERTVQGPTAEVNYSAGVRFLSTAPAKVADCDISGFAQGISGAKNATHVRITGNRIHGISSGQHGVYLSLIAGGLIFTDNIIDDCYDCGMKVQIADPTGTESADIIVNDNVITSTGGQAILLTNIETVAPQSLVPTRRFAIEGNVCTDNTRGIQVNDCQNGTVLGNVISDGRANGTGINVEQSSGITVAHNRITNVPLYGMRLTDAADCQVVHNRIKDPATQGDANTSSRFGIQVTGASPDLVIANNIVTDSVGQMLYAYYLNHTAVTGGLETLAFYDNRGVSIKAGGYGARFASSMAIRAFHDNDLSGATAPMLNPPLAPRVIRAWDFGVRTGTGTDQGPALARAFTAAKNAGGGAYVILPPGVLTIDGGFSLSGYSSGMIGAGGNALASLGATQGTVIRCINQTGPVLNFTGFLFPNAQRGRVMFQGFTVEGDGTGGATKKGIYLGTTTSSSSVSMRDVTVLNTGGPGLHVKDHYLSDFTGVTVCTPISAAVNDVPYVLLEGASGNRFYGLGIRSLVFDGTADCGVSGAVRLLMGATFQQHQALFSGMWFENMHTPTGAALVVSQTNAVTFSDTEFFDCFKVTAATGTAFFRLEPPASSNNGGNIVRGVIPGRGTNANDIDYGVDVLQSGNRIEGTKGYRNNNVRIASGVEYTTVFLGGAVLAANSAAVEDNSGNTTNTLVDAAQGDWNIGGRSASTARIKLLGVDVGDKLSTLATQSGSWAINLASGQNRFVVPLGGATTMTGFTNATGQAGREVTLILKQDATGGRTVSWHSSVKFANTAPTLSSAANAVDVLTFVYDGTNWRETSRALGQT